MNATPDLKSVLLLACFLALAVGVMLAVLDDLQAPRIIVVRADHDLAPHEIAQLQEEARRITREAADDS